MIKNNKTCILCGNKYTYCNGCSEFDHLPYWMICYCSKNCKDIFDTLSAYNMNQITKGEAKNTLSKCDLSNKHSFKESTLNCVNSIMEETIVEKSIKEDLKHQPVTEKVEEVIIPVVETPVIDTDDIKSSQNKSFINDPVMGDSSVKTKRMKYTNKKNN